MRYLVLVSCLCIMACTNEHKTTPAEDSTDTTVSKTMQADTGATVVPACYAHQTSNNLVLLKLTALVPQVAGNLTYDFLGKDKNEGTISGKMSGDTLFADYRFMLKGKEAVREVAFLKRGGAFVEGTADIQQDGDTVKFSKTDTLSFSGPELKLVPCPQP